MVRMGTTFSNARRVLSAILAALVAPLTASAFTVTTAPAAHADTVSPAPVGGTVAGGYVLGASDGGVYNFGAHDFGSMGGKPLAKPIVGHGVDPVRATATGWWRPTAGSSPSATPPSTARPATSR